MGHMVDSSGRGTADTATLENERAGRTMSRPNRKAAPASSVGSFRDNSSLPISRRLARFTASIEHGDVPGSIRTQAQHLILDAVGLALASTRYDYAHKAATAMRALGGTGDHVVFGMPLRLPLRDAIFLNGVLIHGLDYDDTHLPGIIHATASLFPAVHGAAVHKRTTGRDLVTAYIIGMECAARLAMAAKGGFHHVGFHPTGVVGTFGCALAAGRLYALNEEQLTMAQGVALSYASGCIEFIQDGAWTKRTHPGHAAACGLTAAVLAQQGFTGPALAYEGRFGLYNTYLGAGAGNADLSLTTAGLGDRWEISAVAVKPFPACHFTHSAADAVLALLHENGFTPEDVERVLVQLPQEMIPTVCEPVAKKRRPKNGYDAKFSIPYVVAAAMVKGKLGIQEFDDDRIGDPVVLALANRVDCAPDPDSVFPRYFSARVSVTLKDGRTLTHRESTNRGSEDRPLSHTDIVDKYMDNAMTAVSRDRAERVRDLLLGLDGIDDMSTISKVLTG